MFHDSWNIEHMGSDSREARRTYPNTRAEVTRGQ